MESIKNIIEERATDLVKGLIGVVLVLVIGITIFSFKSPDEKVSTADDLLAELMVEQDEVNIEEELTTQIPETGKIVVDIKGEVKFPGVYEMDPDSRVIDCIEKAGGFLEEAEQKSVNLAQRIEDQMVIYIPFQGEELDDLGLVEVAGTVDESLSKSPKVNLNKASIEELKTLNGIGDSKAANIISYREEQGHFQKIEDIKNVSGIGEATFEKLKDEIEVTP